MKKVLAVILALIFVMSLDVLTAAADDTVFNAGIAGTITMDGGNISCLLKNDNIEFNLDGKLGDAADFRTAFEAEVSGSINGTVKGSIYNENWPGSLYGVITTSEDSQTIGIIGQFTQTGDFTGKLIKGELPAPVTELTIKSDTDTVSAGSTLKLTAVTKPEGSYDVLWSVCADDPGRATIGQDGILTTMKTGTVTVIVNTLDPSLANAKETITITDQKPKVSTDSSLVTMENSDIGTPDVSPAFIIVIPTKVEFGTLTSNTGEIKKDFKVQATDVNVETGSHVDVTVSSPFVMKDKNGTGNIGLPYLLKNHLGIVKSGEIFASFTQDGSENGSVFVNTDKIIKAGSYTGTMVFTITYVR